MLYLEHIRPNYNIIRLVSENLSISITINDIIIIIDE